MDLTLYNNYLYSRKLGLDVAKQKRVAYEMYDYIKKTYTSGDYNGQDTLDNRTYLKYNYLLYAIPEIHDLYNEIKNTFHASLTHKHGNEPYAGKYFIQCWLNFYHKGKFIDWHKHWEPEYGSWHGFYCVDVEPDSHTSYRLPDGSTVDVKSENDLLVLGPSDNDEHRSSEWQQDYPRITIAFDIIPAEVMYKSNETFVVPNHWIPI
jgi:hypothetical protein